MIVFSEEFRKSDGKPIKYKGKSVVMWDQFPLVGKICKIKFRIISTNSEWKQGLSLKIKGKFVFDDGDEIQQSMVIWQHTAPDEDEFICNCKDGFLDIKNVWDTGNGCIESWTNGAAMWIEEIPGGRRYHCNDGHFDDDFDDIVFEIIVV